jgi:YYY domain-containing protein
MEYALVVRWLLLFAAVTAAGVPIAARLFRVPGRGAGLALPVALVVLTLPAYWIGHLSLTAGLIVGVVVLVGVSVAAGADLSALRAGTLRPAPRLELDRRALAETAAVFTVAFCLLVAVRAVDPAVHALGGEKFLDFGLLKSLARSEALPPEDMWFAGEPVRYYYGGHLVASLLSRLSLTPPRFAYNLALAGFYAMLVAAAYDLAATISAARYTPHDATPDRPREGSARLAGLLGAFFVGFAANLHTASDVALGLLPAGVGTAVATWIADGTGGDPAEILDGASGFFYFDASRIIPGTINEFPLFAWLNGDLHAHMMGLPFVLLAAGLAFAYYETPASAVGRRRLLVFGAVPVVAGLQSVVDTWSFPTLFGLLFLGVAFAPAHPLTLLPRGSALLDRVGAVGRDGDAGSRLAGELGRLGAALGVAVIAGVVGVVLSAPFVALAMGGGSSRSLEILAAAERSSLQGLVLVHGGFVAAFGAYLLTRIGRVTPVLVGVAAVALVASAVDLPVLLLTAPLLVVGFVALRFDRPVGFETVLVVGGAGLVTMVELVYLTEQAGPLRMNTVFKFYIQTWALWGVAAGAALAGLVRGTPSETAATTPTRGAVAADGGGDGGSGRDPAGSGRDGGDRGTSGGRGGRLGVGLPVGRVLAVGLVVLLVVSTSTYGVFALGNHFENTSEPTLDATAFVDRQHPDEASAIRWLDEREGRPTLLSAPGTTWHSRGGTDERERGMYAWTSNPAASLTGVPTVAGWQHEVGYRGPDAYYSRVRDVDTMFLGTPDEQARLLRQYDVEYIWIGPSEKLRYDDVTVTELEGVEPAYERGSVTVYRVDADELPAG